MFKSCGVHLSVALIQGWHLYEGSIYLKSNLFLAHNIMVTEHLNLFTMSVGPPYIVLVFQYSFELQMY